MKEMGLKRCSAAILCGGNSVRMGTDKAVLVFEGERLIDRKLRQFQAFEEIFLSVRNEEQLKELNIRRVTDPEKNQGPFCALVSILAASGTEWTAVCAVDMPYVDAETMETLLSYADPDTEVIIPVTEKGFEPLAAVYRSALRDRVRAAYRQGTRRMMDFIQTCRVREIPAAAFVRGEETFRNLNTRMDLCPRRSASTERIISPKEGGIAKRFSHVEFSGKFHAAADAKTRGMEESQSDSFMWSFQENSTRPLTRNRMEPLAAACALKAAAEPVSKEETALKDLAGRVAAEDVFAKIPLPVFDKSPYDGYAFRAEDTVSASREKPAVLRVLGVLYAGDVTEIPVKKGEAYRIMTGAALPPGADCIINYELTSFTEDAVTIPAAYPAGTNVIRCGEELSAGERLITRGQRITPPMLGLLSTQGIGSCLVYRKPRVAVIVTGSELTLPGQPLPSGHIYESVSVMLTAYLEKLGFEVTGCELLSDDAERITEKLREHSLKNDLIVMTGGVSVGDKDYAKTALACAGAETILSEIRMKPGSCTAAGVMSKEKAGRTLILCLSGNPGAAFTAFFAVCMPALKKICGRTDTEPACMKLPLLYPMKKKSGQTRFLRGRLLLSDGRAFFAENDHQGNGMLRSFSDFDLMAEIPAGSDALPAGAEVTVYRITW
ncbi:MAG: NTP transferase domain-containing protein [Lachnospiraceae bacterium]|nr:NTP transferase domain-containing protein [Lachnospiraceae bacterium]